MPVKIPSKMNVPKPEQRCQPAVKNLFFFLFSSITQKFILHFAYDSYDREYQISSSRQEIRLVVVDTQVYSITPIFIVREILYLFCIFSPPISK